MSVFEESTSSSRSSETETEWVLDYGILKVLFEYLNIRDLYSCSRVCKDWHSAGQIVRKERKNRPRKPGLLLYHIYPLDRTREVVELSNAFRVSESTIAWANNPSTIPRQYELKRDIRSRILRNELEPALWNTVYDQFSEPAQIICIGTNSLAPYFELNKGPGTQDSDEGPSSSKINLFRRMGKVSPCIGVLGYGLVFTMPDSSLCLENECRTRQAFFPMIAGLVVPQVRGLKIRRFSLTVAESMKLKKSKVTAENCKSLLNIQPEDDVKGIILFQTHQTRSLDENLLLSAVHEYLKKHPNVAFGGGLFNNAFTNEDNGQLIGCGLVICGDENIRVGSAAFLEEGVTEQNLNSLKKFKDAGLPGHGCTDFALMFCCNGRGFLMHNAEHLESSLFRSEYPNTALIGAFTGGEYFHPYVHGQSTPASPPANKVSSLKFGYATVFVYISCSE